MGAAQIHDKYGKAVLDKAFGTRFSTKDCSFKFNGNDKQAGIARIDGILDGEIAVEIESRASKQVRGALLDLAFHPMKKKLLVVIKKHGNEITPIQAEVILTRLCGDNSKFKVVKFEGSGDEKRFNIDVQKIKNAVEELITD